jgi:hypothetical protein
MAARPAESWARTAHTAVASGVSVDALVLLELLLASLHELVAA